MRMNMKYYMAVITYFGDTSRYNLCERKQKDERSVSKAKLHIF